MQEFVLKAILIDFENKKGKILKSLRQELITRRVIGITTKKFLGLSLYRNYALTKLGSTYFAVSVG